MNFFTVLLFLLTTGIFLMLHRIPHGEIGDRFYKLVTYLFLIGLAIVLLSSTPDTFAETIQYLLLLIMTGGGFAHLWSLKRANDQLRRIFYWCSVILGLTIIGSITFFTPISTLLSDVTSPALAFVQLTLSAAIMGAIVDAMICGHWYLVNTGLSLTPIRSISQALTAVILLKIAVVSYVLYRTKLHDPYLFDRILYTLPILFWVRILVGLAGGLFFNWMSWKALEYDNTQAATGILYACITWIILGEFSGFYMTIQTGVPF